MLDVIVDLRSEPAVAAVRVHGRTATIGTLLELHRVEEDSPSLCALLSDVNEGIAAAQ